MRPGSTMCTLTIDTPRVIVRPSDNQMVWRWDNADPFGNTSPNNNPAGLGQFVYNPRFPGQLYDAETGTYYNINRNYDPALGRYVQSDPIELAGGLNTYSYVFDEPLSFRDIRGLAAGPINSGGTWYSPPAPLSPTTGYAVCDGSGLGGGMEPQLPILTPIDGYCVGDCLAAHEQSHINDFRKINPTICAGVPRGWRPSFPSTPINNGSERNAYDAERNCLLAKLLSLPDCDICRQIIEKYLGDIPGFRKQYE